MIYSILTDESTVGERVRYYRQKRNLTQGQLAKWAGCSVGVISRLECHNSIPSADILLSICRELSVAPVYIFKNSQYMNILLVCVHGKTLYSSDGSMSNFKFVKVSSDFKIEKSKYICVEYDGRIFLANKGVSDNCELCLCSERSSGKCFVVNSTELDKEQDKYSLIAGLAEDITEISAPVTM